MSMCVNEKERGRYRDTERGTGGGRRQMDRDRQLVISV